MTTTQDSTEHLMDPFEPVAYCIKSAYSKMLHCLTYILTWVYSVYYASCEAITEWLKVHVRLLV